MKIVKHNWLFWSLLCLDTAVVVIHLLGQDVYGFFRLDGEQNLNSLFAGLKFLSIGALTLMQFFILQKIDENIIKRIVWLLVTVSFVYLGLDEMAALHERIGFVLNNLRGATDAEGASFNWIVYYAPLILVALLVYARFIALTLKEHRPAAMYMSAGILLFMTGLGVEVVSARIVYPRGIMSGDFTLYFASVLIEETAELVGATCFLVGVWKSFTKSFQQNLVWKKT